MLILCSSSAVNINRCLQVVAAVSSFILACFDLTPFEDSDCPALLCESPSLSSLNSLIFSYKAAFCKDSPSLYLSQRAHSHPLTGLLYYLLSPNTDNQNFSYFCPNTVYPLFIFIHTHSDNQCVLSEIIRMLFNLNFSDDHTTQML